MKLEHRKAFIAIGLLWAGHFTVDLYTGIFYVYKTVSGIDIALAGKIASFAGFFGNFFQLAFGFLADKGGRKYYMAAGLVFAASASFYSLTSSMWVLAFLAFATFAGSACFHPAATACAGALSERRKGLAISTFISGGYMGFGLSQILFMIFYEHLRSYVWMMALGAYIMAIFIIRTPFREIAKPIGSKWTLEKLKAIKPLMRELGLLYVLMVLNSATQLALTFSLPELSLERGHGGWISHGGAHLSFVFLTALACSYTGYLADKFGPKKLIVSLLACSSLLYYGSLFMPVLPAPLYLLNIAVLGTSLGLVIPIGVTLGNRLAPGRSSLVSAFLMGMVWCVAFIAPMICGMLIKALDSSTEALMWMGIAQPVAFILALCLRPTAAESA